MDVDAEKVKALLSIHGDVRSQPSSDWTGPFDIPPQLSEFYREVGPMNVTIESVGNPYFLPCLGDLWQFQAGYRWNGLTGEPIDDWDDDWIVVANEGGDPFILSPSSGAILHAYHGEGRWDVGELFPSCNSMAACLAQLGAIVLEQGDDLFDEDYSIKADGRAIALCRLKELLGSERDADSVLSVLGWG